MRSSSTIKRLRASNVADLFMAATMRSWFAVWWNSGFVALYFVWNAVVPTNGRFDPYPYPFLCTMLTAFSYLQGPIIMTMQWINDQAQRRQEEIMRRQVLYQLHMMEAIHAHLKGTAFLDRSEIDPASGSGVPGDGPAPQ